MSDTHSPHGFDTVRRGYERAQVDERITKLVSDRDSALSRISALEKRIEELHLETQNAQTSIADAEPSYAGLGARVEKILRLAEEEAKELREEAHRAAEQHRELAEAAAQQVRSEAEAYAKERKAKAEDDGRRIIDKANSDSTQLRAEATKDAQRPSGRGGGGLREPARQGRAGRRRLRDHARPAPPARREGLHGAGQRRRG
jgi:Zn-ribbon protein, possibly nucleic acid-binding